MALTSHKVTLSPEYSYIYYISQTADGSLYMLANSATLGLAIVKFDTTSNTVTNAWTAPGWGQIVASGSYVAMASYGNPVQVLNTADGTWAPYEGLAGTNGYTAYIAPGFAPGTFGVFGEDYDGVNTISWRLNRIDAAAGTATQIASHASENLYEMTYSTTRDAIWIAGDQGTTEVRLSDGTMTHFHGGYSLMLTVAPGGQQ